MPKSAWACADPGVQFDTTINEWHTCAESGRINASNPCSEYMFLDDTACNLASFNLMNFRDDAGVFQVKEFEHAVRLWTITLEISVLMAQYPSQTIAQLSYDYRTLGLGYANIGGLLMAHALPYDSDEGRALCGAITAFMTGASYAASAEMAGELGAFPGYARERRVDAAGHPQPSQRGPRRQRELRRAVGHPGAARPRSLSAAGDRHGRGGSLGRALTSWASEHGFRNAQTTVIAPTGTVALVMDCDTTGIEPDFALVKFKKLAGGGYFKIINRTVPEALSRLGYDEEQIEEIVAYAVGHGTLGRRPGHRSCGAQG